MSAPGLPEAITTTLRKRGAKRPTGSRLAPGRSAIAGAKGGRKPPAAVTLAGPKRGK